MNPSEAPENALSAASPGDTRSASDAVFYGVVNGLEAQRFAPGQRLVEVDLAQQFGVGRNSVREALQRLAADGIVNTFRHRGVAIKSLSARQTLDVLDVAERMTGLLARSAARGIQAGKASQPIGVALDQLRAAEDEGDSEAFGRARRNFYRALLEASGSLELKRLFPSIQMPIVYAQHRFAALQKLRLRDYAAMGRSVMDADEEAADAAGMNHVRNVRAEILRKIGAEPAGDAPD
ncbi:GntR family transcriptional regulator [Acidovorax carolinensis]|uniref:GntR family transcriptional regulator n=1 Tax=Acidovorax carolinensis TaxID=553814 RepID=UPI000B347898|nr:GntR family transcriptional regulator [Acidovorax carolinensis]ART49482.1 GntR family transcriptional regulator [Acidovorax carolinensis]